MAELTNEFGRWNNMLNTPIDALTRRAQMGEPWAIKEMVMRGIDPPPVGGTTRNMARPAATNNLPMNAERPPYLQRGISRDMGRPGGGVNPDAAAFERAGRQLMPDQSPALPNIDVPPYLSQPGIPGTPQQGRPPMKQSPVDEMLTSIANGNDGAAAIQAGVQQADEDAGVGDPMAELGPLGPVAQAMASVGDGEVDNDPYGGQIQDIIGKLMAGHDPDSRRNMALAEAGFAMAASGAPYFLQGVGIGGQAGLKSYRESEERDLENMVRAGTMAGQEGTRQETRRSNRTQEQLEADRLAEVAAENARVEGRFGRTQAESERHNRQVEQDNAQARALQAQGNDLEAQQLADARAQFERTQALAEKGAATKEELDKAEAALRRAQAASAEALELDRYTTLDRDDQGNLIKIDSRNNQVTYITDVDGNKVKGQIKGTNTITSKEQILKRAGWTDQQIAAAIAGTMTPAQMVNAATNYATNAANDPTLFGADRDAAYRAAYEEAMTSLRGGGAPSGGTPAQTAPITTPTPNAEKPPVPGANKAPDGNWYVPDPNRPGKYLKVE